MADFDPPPGAFMRGVGAFVGTIAAIENLFILFVFFRTKRLLKSSSLLIGLTSAHALNAIAHVILGSWPVSFDMVMIPASFCVKIFWPAFYISIYQFLPIILAMNALERLLALGCPMWYRTKCTNARMWRVTLASFGLCFILIGINQLKGYFELGPLISASCVPPFVFGVWYMIIFVHFLAILGGLCAVGFTAVGVYVGRRRIAKLPSGSKSEINRMRKQLRLTTCLLMISGLDVLCVVIPNIVLVLYNFHVVYFPLRFAIFPDLIYCSDSLWNIVAFILFNSEFRKEAKKLLCRNSQIEPTSMYFTNSRISMRARPNVIRETNNLDS